MAFKSISRGSCEPLFIKTSQIGFTLVEMVLTIVILGILSYITFSIDFNFSQHEDGNAYQQSISVIRNAQKYAISRRSVSYVIISNSQILGCWDTSCTAKILTVDGGPLQTDIFSNKFSNYATPIMFLPDGSTTAQFSITIGANTLTVENVTGYAR